MIFTLLIVLVISRFGRARSTRSDFYSGDQAFTASQNGIALFGSFLMMTSFLALSGEIALAGYDGVLLAAGFAVSWLVMLILIAEPIRNTARYTLGDALSARLKERPVRVAAAIITLVVVSFFMLAQLVSAGSLVAFLLGLDGPIARALVITTVGSLTAAIVYYGGMRGTTWTQVVEAVLLLAAVVVLAGALLARYRFDVSTLLGDAAARAGSEGERILTPGAKFGHGMHRLEFVSQLLTTVLGYAALPYMFLRFLTVPSAKRARSSAAWAIWLLTPYYLLVILIGFGAAALIGPTRIVSAPGQGMSAVPLLAFEIGGVLLLAFIASVLFTTIIGVTAGLAITAAAGITRDIYTSLAKSAPLDERREIAVARRVVVILCVLLTVCGVLLMNQNTALMTSLGVTLAASSILPTLLFSWFWRRFNTAGALWSLYGGAVATVVLVALSPTVSGDPLALFPDADFAYFPWSHVGLVSMPLSALLGFVGAKLSAERNEAKFAEMEVRALTGAGSAEVHPGGAVDPRRATSE